eukprot:TRINITY_DN9510_c0_g1_i1.p1 TRINITY_DN9510_c0_g1~~TRINITY_DN9510_c0_g1_i1.p1  ORF type:complete len:473 (-),score=169.40 TRINITY_DN9510_c0_g1_i1:414-1832(-)
MCTLRGIWIFRDSEVVFSRRYPTVENRVSLFSGSHYTQIPVDAELRGQFEAAVGPSERPDEPPVNVLSLCGGALWPVVWLKRLGLLFVTIVVVDDPWTPTHKPPLIELPCITAAAAFLEDVVALLAPFGSAASDFKPSMFAELQVAVAKAAPFGTPRDTNWVAIGTMARVGFPASDVPSASRRPAWKPFLHRGRQKLEFRIQERIQCAQYDKETVPDRAILSGILYCKAELEQLPEVSICLATGTNRRDVPTLAGIVVDPCVQIGSGDASGSSASGFTKLTFTPPLEQFTLAKFSLSGAPAIPIRGFYQMKPVSNSTIRLLVQLKLVDKAYNSFEFCDVTVPTFNRGPIAKHDTSITPTNGSVALSADRQALVWSIGTKFSGKNQECSLSAIIHFDADQQPPVPDEPFLTGANAYIQLRFKMLDASLSGVSVDAPTLSIYPACKPQLTIEREVVADDYVIWNSVGNARFSIQ